MPRRHPAPRYSAGHYTFKSFHTLQQDAAMRAVHATGICWLCSRAQATAGASFTIRRKPFCATCQEAVDKARLAARNAAGSVAAD